MNSRPNPDLLLHAIGDQSRKRGRLKIFFGAAPGVGKTYAMLEAAARELKSGTDLVIGYLEPHQRPDTMALAKDIPTIEPRVTDYRGVKLTELDLDAALKRKPALILVDELAHTNAPGSANNKRWQDVEHLLDAGIDVYTTLNVQHLETINDVVAQATGVAVRETLPDDVFESAWEVELIDLAPDELLERLKAGKVYLPEQAERARDSFFKKGNLIALRDLALRQTAERIDRELDNYRRIDATSSTFTVRDKLLVCVGPSPLSAKLIRATRRMAASLRCRWLAVHIDVVGRTGSSSGLRERVLKNLQLAERLGAETAILTASDMVSELLQFARERNISKIIVGKPLQPRWKELIFGSFVYSLTRKCREIDVYVISGDPDKSTGRHVPAKASNAIDWNGYLCSAGIVGACTALNWMLWSHFNPLNLVMVYLLGVVAVASRFSRGPSIFAALSSVLLFDFLFVSPYWTFSVSDTEYFFTFAVMLLTGLTISSLTLRLRAHGDILRESGQRTSRLFQFSRALSECASPEEAARLAALQIGEAAKVAVAIVLRAPDGTLAQQTSAGNLPFNQQLHAVASWSFDHEQPAGKGTEILSGSSAAFLPLSINGRKFGVVGLEYAGSLIGPDRLEFVQAFIDVLINALDRLELAAEAAQSRLAAESERVRNILLSTVSHDLRTPLAAIEGASSTLLESDSMLSPDVRRSLLESVVQEVEFLNRLVGNLLDATRIDSGTIVLRKEWQSLEELIGAVVNRLQRVLTGREVVINLSDHLPLFRADAVLFHQVLINLLENAAKFSPPGSKIEFAGYQSQAGLEITVSDRGPGIAEADLPFLFDKFYRGQMPYERQGAGLGLAVCKGIIELHGGTIRAENRNSGGAQFKIVMPLEPQPEAPPETVVTQ